MADRKVTSTGKDTDGDITGLCGSWGEASSAVVIAQIEAGTYRYYVSGRAGTESDVNVVNGPTRKYLRSDPDGSPVDNLDELPAC